MHIPELGTKANVLYNGELFSFRLLGFTQAYFYTVRSYIVSLE